MPTITVSTSTPAVDLHVEDVGTGRPVVLIHGWPLSSRSWEAQVPALVEAGHRVITYDRRGFGASSQPWTGYDYDTLAADLRAVVTELDLHDVTLVGFSMGGGEVARYLSSFGSDRIAAAVFAAAVPPYLYKSDDNPDGGLDDATIASFEDGVRGDRIAFLDGFTQQFFGAGDRTDLVSEPFRLYARSIAEFASPKGTLDCIGAFARTDFRRDLATIDVPTLVIHGDSDGIVPFEVSGKRTHEAVAGSRLVVVEGGPHGLNTTHADEFNQALLDFLATLTTGAGSAPTAPAAATAAPEEPAGRHEATGAAATPTGTTTSDTAAPATTAAPAAAPATPPTSTSTDDTDGGSLAGLTWRTAEQDDDTAPSGGRPNTQDVREGRVADTNLGDIPVDEQPHPGSAT